MIDKSSSCCGKWSVLLALLFCCCCAFRSVAQERISLSNTTLKKEDTAAIMQLIHKGLPYLYTNADSALILFSEAEQYSRRIGFDDGLAYALSFKGAAATNLGDYKLAFASYGAALPYCLRSGDVNRLITLYLNIGTSWSRKGDYTQAARYYYMALNYLQKYLPTSASIIATHVNLANVQGKIGNHRQVLYHARKAEQLALAHKSWEMLGAALLNEGDAYAAMNITDSAMMCYNTGLSIVRKKGYKEIEQAYLVSIGDLMMKRNAVKEAVSYYRQAFALGGSGDPLYGSIIPGYSLGEALYQLKEYQEAKQVLIHSLALAEKTGLTDDSKDAYATLAMVYAALGDYQHAFHEKEKYELLNDSINSVQKVSAIHEIEDKYLSVQKDKELTSKELIIALKEKQLSKKNILIESIVLLIGVSVIILLLVYRNRQKVNIHKREIDNLRSLMMGEERERTRLSRELHDGIGGMLTGIKLNLISLQNKNKVATLKNEELEGLMNMLQDMGDEVHKASYNLTPDILERYNLKQALLFYCEQLEAGQQLKISLQCYGDLDVIDKSLELSLYRVIQELIQNIVKHAGAGQAAIQIKQSEQKLYISVEDNGHGFDVAEEKQGLGLQNIRSRVQIMGGYFSIESAPGMGTIAYIEINLA